MTLLRSDDVRSGAPERSESDPGSLSSVRASEPRTSSLSHESPGGWLDALLVTVCEVPLDATAESIAQSFADAVAPYLPDVAVGICVAGEGTRQIVVRRLPDENRRSLTQDPTRLFPEFEHERVVHLDDEPSSASIHLAADDPHLIAPGGAHEHLLDRLRLTLAAALRQRALQEQFIQTDKLASLGEIAAGIVHELNNPLTSIVAYADYLKKKGEAAGADAGDLLRMRHILEAAERIQRFSRDLTAYSRPATDVPEPVSIHDVIDQALVFCEHVLGQSGVSVEREFGGLMRPVRGVAGQLTQVFVNLFTNACQAMDAEGGRLSIRTLACEGEVEIEIRDNGHGIAADAMPKIFEPFFTTKGHGRGTGLGLSIVRKIVKGHGGRIEVRSVAAGGTAFVVNLPVLPERGDE